MSRPDSIVIRCRALLCLLLSLAMANAFAQASASRFDFSIQAQPLSSALLEFAKQANVQVLTAGSNLESARTRGVSGKYSAGEAINHLLDGTSFAAEFTDASTVVIKPVAARPGTAANNPQTHAGAATESSPRPNELETVTVTGSHIPRAEVEGPAPITVITAADIAGRGFANAADIMTSLTQNLGALDNNQYTNGFSPGAQAVDLRGLGPNHTLVLINGRRIADYPQAYGGNSNFTDITNIPTTLIDRIEVLSGSASAVYGSDAISGVVNFILKKEADGTQIDLRLGDTQHGGGASQRLTITSGWSNDRLSSVFGVELYNQSPLWAYQRSFTDSRTDGPGTVVPSQVWVRMDEDENYIDPGKSTCDALASYDQGSIIHAHRRNWGDYCGSNKDVGYGTLQNGRKAANFYGSASYRIDDHINFFADLQYSTSHQDSYNTPLQWENSYPLNGDSTPIPFYNQATGIIEQWQRRYFTIEENGGFKPGEIRNINNTWSLNTGLKGTFGESWNYEALFSHSQDQLESKWPALLSAKAQALYLGPSLGTDPDSGLQIYDAPVSRLYTPLSVAEFRSITQDSIDNNTSRAEIYSITLSNIDLFQMPAGPVGFAALAEYGNQYFGMKPDPLSLDGSYFGLHNTGAVGSRSHNGIGAEISMPLTSQLTVSGASRYDRYNYSDNSSAKLTYALGLEYRPFDSLLLRGSASTGFRAPDLTYLYAGLSGSSSGGTDYYLCHRDQPDVDIGDCDYSDVGFNGRSHGSTTLNNETSKSFTYGVVYSPVRGLDFSADYYIIRLKNEVEYQSSDDILRFESDCRLGTLDINSAFCQQIISQVVRNSPNAVSNPEGITSVMVLPINAATDSTSGIDFSAHYLLETGRAGNFNFNLGYTYVVTHEVQLSPDLPVDNILTDFYYYVLPRSKANYSVAWSLDSVTTTLYGARIGGIPNFDGDKRMGPTFLYNATASYRFNDRAGVTLTIDNLFDSKPGRDSSWTSYPYYSRNWFSPVGRAWYVDFSYRFGGKS